MHPLNAIDRCCTLALHHLQGRRACRSAVVLMYHSISEPPRPNRGWSYYGLHVPPAVFARQLDLLHSHRIAVVPLTELLTPSVESRPAVSITFDDGYRDFYEQAFPLLRRYNYPATVYLPTAKIGTIAKSFNDLPLLSWEQVRQLHQAGICFGSHTVNHPRLWQLSPQQLRYELQHSKLCLEEQLRESIDSFAHPYAFPEADVVYVQRLLETLRQCGYRTAVTTRIGTLRGDDHPLCLKRIPVHARDDEQLFAAKLAGAYDWLYTVQRFHKKWRYRLSPHQRRNQPPAHQQVAPATNAGASGGGRNEVNR